MCLDAPDKTASRPNRTYASAFLGEYIGTREVDKLLGKVGVVSSRLKVLAVWSGEGNKLSRANRTASVSEI